MSNPFYQPLDPQSPPDPVTPQASPSDPAGFASVTPHGQGPAWYDIQAPLDEAAITAAYNGSLAVAGGDEGAPTGAGLPDRRSPRQSEAAALLNSPQGSGAMNITAGFAGGGGESWPADPSPSGADWTMENATGSPTGINQGTGTD